MALRQVEAGAPIAEVCRKMEVAEATFFRWKKTDVGLGVAELRRLKQLEAENRKLKQLAACSTCTHPPTEEGMMQKPGS